MVLEPQVFDYINDEETAIFERQPLERLSQDSKLNAFKYEGFWKCMDTQRDKYQLEELWQSGRAPWMVWE
jgi:glucose-1-phosphate cytidylyltransferase